MKALVAIALGGGAGALMRHYAVLAVAALLGTAFPYGTLGVNVLGSFLMGMIVEGCALKWNMPLEMKLFLTTGMLGAFTTFSAFSLDAFRLVETGQQGYAAVYVIASVALSVVAVFGGIYIMRGMFG